MVDFIDPTELDVSNDIFDNIMFFLDNLPKNKVKLEVKESLLSSKNSSLLNFIQQSKEQNLEKKSLFSDFLNHSQKVDSIVKFNREELHER